jgi:hypothetical protein
MRTPVPGTVARGWLREDAESRTGKDAAGEYLLTSPKPWTDEMAARGAERYGIYCRPCHTSVGNGKGIITEKAGLPVPSFHEERLRTMPDGQIFETITQGKGLMPAYAYPIPAADRWAIVAHVRRLQQEGEGAVVAER